MSNSIIDYILKWASTDGEKDALIDSTKKLNYKELAEKVTELQFSLHEMSLVKGDTVAISGDRSVNLVVLYISLMGMGINVVPIPETKFYMNKVSEILKETCCNYLVQVNSKYEIYNYDNNNLIFQKNIASSVHVKFNSKNKIRNESNYNYYNLTSGSTGKIKVIKADDYHIIYNAVQMNSKFPIATSDCYCCLFSSDMHPHELFVKSLVNGSTCLLLNTLDLRKFNYYIKRYNVTHLLTTPNVLKKMLYHFPDKKDWESLKYVFCGGERIPLSFREEFYKKIGKALIVAWGSTETNGIVITLSDSHKYSSNSIGYPLPGYEIKINPNEEIMIKGKSCLDKYWNINEKKIITKDGYYKTGDFGSRDKTGLIQLWGRLDSIIKVSGRKISLSDIESDFEELYNIEKCKIVYIDYTLIVFIIMQKGRSLKEISLPIKLREIFEQLNFRLIEIDKYPILPSGKVDTQKLIKNFANT